MKNKKSKIICLCNSISEEVIKKAIVDGAKNADDLYDRTGAGVGPCGGSCRKTTTKWIEYYRVHKKFPPTK